MKISRYSEEKLFKFIYYFSERRNGGMASIPENVTVFQKKYKKGIIDVWWLYDDGGNLQK